MLRTGPAEPGRQEHIGKIFARSKERLRIGLYSMLLAVDLLCIVAAYLVAASIRLHSPLSEQTFHTLAIVLPTFLAASTNNGAYSLKTLESRSCGAEKAIKALLWGSLVAIALLFYLKVSTDFSRVIFAVGTIFSPAFVIAGRLVTARVLRRKYGGSFANQLTILDGATVPPTPGEATVLADQLGLHPGIDDPMMLHRLSYVLEGCDRVVVACPPERRALWAVALKGTALNVEILVPELGRLGATDLGTFNGQKTAVVSSGPLNVRDRAIKRTLDIIIAGLALLFFAPLMLFVAVVVKLDSPGPVIFTQQRLGRCNRLFYLLKFRSMRQERLDPRGARSASVNDDRFTRVGRFIRRTSLDELPQLLNVLGGSMSIVGPRPHALGSTAEESL
ncbi:MAG: sugar transferase, partial [Sphingomicrobium sp.]